MFWKCLDKHDPGSPSLILGTLGHHLQLGEGSRVAAEGGMLWGSHSPPSLTAAVPEQDVPGSVSAGESVEKK